MSKRAVHEPARVLYVHHGGGNGGAANSLLYLLQNLDRQRYEPLVACNFRTPTAREFFSDHGFRPVDLPIAQFVHMMKTWQLQTPRGLAKFLQWAIVKQPASSASFNRLLAALEPDLVHLNSLSIAPLAPAARRLGIPVVLHVRESVNEGNFGLRKAWLKRVAERNVNHVVYICSDNQERLTGRGPRSSVVYNPIEFRKFKACSGLSARRDLGIPPDDKVLFFPGGSFFDIKGILPFLEAFATVHKTHANTWAIIPGLDVPPHPRDPVRRTVEQIIEAYGLQSAVLRLPFTTEVETYYAACSVVVAPFVHPHFSRAVIEAGAMRRPVIGSRIGGITEVLEDGKVGLLSKPGDSEELARKICFMIEHEESALAMGQAGYVVARERFNAIDHARSIMKVYDNVLSEAEELK